MDADTGANQYQTATAADKKCIWLTVGHLTGFVLLLSPEHTWQIVSHPTSGHHVLLGSSSTSVKHTHSYVIARTGKLRFFLLRTEAKCDTSITAVGLTSFKSKSHITLVNWFFNHVLYLKWQVQVAMFCRWDRIPLRRPADVRRSKATPKTAVLFKYQPLTPTVCRPFCTVHLDRRLSWRFPRLSSPSGTASHTETCGASWRPNYSIAVDNHCKQHKTKSINLLMCSKYICSRAARTCLEVDIRRDTTCKWRVDPEPGRLCFEKQRTRPSLHRCSCRYEQNGKYIHGGTKWRINKTQCSSWNRPSWQEMPAAILHRSVKHKCWMINPRVGNWFCPFLWRLRKSRSWVSTHSWEKEQVGAQGLQNESVPPGLLQPHHKDIDFWRRFLTATFAETKEIPGTCSQVCSCSHIFTPAKKLACARKSQMVIDDWTATPFDGLPHKPNHVRRTKKFRNEQQEALLWAFQSSWPWISARK